MSNPKSIIEMTTELVRTFLEHNAIRGDELPQVILGVHKAVKQVVLDTSEETPKSLKATKAEPEILMAPIRPAWTPDDGDEDHAVRHRPRTTQTPAVPINQSVHPDYIICLEDGKRYKMMKHPLRLHYNMSPVEYRKKWGLPSNYPMTAPNYSEARKRIAKAINLGHDIKYSGK